MIKTLNKEALTKLLASLAWTGTTLVPVIVYVMRRHPMALLVSVPICPEYLSSLVYDVTSVNCGMSNVKPKSEETFPPTMAL